MLFILSPPKRHVQRNVGRRVEGSFTVITLFEIMLELQCFIKDRRGRNNRQKILFQFLFLCCKHIPDTTAISVQEVGKTNPFFLMCIIHHVSGQRQSNATSIFLLAVSVHAGAATVVSVFGIAGFRIGNREAILQPAQSYPVGCIMSNLKKLIKWGGFPAPCYLLLPVRKARRLIKTSIVRNQGWARSDYAFLLYARPISRL